MTDKIQPKEIKSNGSWRIPIEAIIELKAKNLCNSEIAKLLGCGPSNISQRLKDVELTKQYVNNRALIFAYHQRRIIESITHANIQKAGLLEKVKATSFLHNAERLELNLSTSNIAYADMIQGRDQRIQELKELEGRFSQSSDSKG